MYRIIAYFFLYLLLLLSCNRNEAPLAVKIENISTGPAGKNFSLYQFKDNLHILYTDRDSLSLRLSIITQKDINLEKTCFLDRISYTPEVDVSFGEHLYTIRSDIQHVFYNDHEAEDRTICKWIYKPLTEERWFIDIIPVDGDLLTLLVTKENIDLFFSKNSSLWFYSIDSENLPECIGEPWDCFNPTGDVCTLSGGGISGFTVFDSSSKQIYLIKKNNSSYISQPLISSSSSGHVHYASVNDNGRLTLLIYNKDSAELSLLEEQDMPLQMKNTPVTLCSGTNSVYFFSIGNNKFFLFDEVSLDYNHKKAYKISLIYPHNDTYKRIALLKSSLPIERIKYLFVNEQLYIVYNQGLLKLMKVDLSDLIEDHNL